jgi:drug/metabolite transporter (DMT)-like permease
MGSSIWNTLKSIEKSGVVMVGIGAALISFSGVYVKLARVSPTMAGFYRALIGAIVLISALFLKREPLWKSFYYFFTALLCGFFFALDLFVWHISIHFIGPGLATILANFQVFLLALFGLLVLREKMRFNLILAIPLAMLGLYLLAGIQWGNLRQNYKAGVFLGLAAALCYAVYILFLRRLQSSNDSLSPMANLAIVSIVTFLMLGTVAWWQGDSFEIPDLQSLLSLLGYGLFSQVIGWILIAKGLPRIKSSLAGLLLLLQPALAFIWDILFFHRETTMMGGIGAIIALTAMYMGATSRLENKT